MPVRKVKGGWRYGKTGKVYKKRSLAERLNCLNSGVESNNAIDRIPESLVLSSDIVCYGTGHKPR